MGNKPVRIAVTGGAGQIAYSLLFRIASGEFLGKQPIALHILEIPSSIDALQGVRMELEDCAFESLQEIRIGSDPFEMFCDVEWAFLIGSKPRSPGMERKDLINENGHIFKEQGKALSEVASKNVQVLVVGNPCNTNCLVAIHNAPNLDPKNFYAMTRLDHNRARTQLAIKANAPISEVTNVTIWGNHSTTQVPDFYHAKIRGNPAIESIPQMQWLKEEFITCVQKRGAEILQARGKSSAASAASSALDAMHAIITPTKRNDWFSMGVYTGNKPYGIDQDLVFSFPCISQGKRDCTVVPGLDWNEFLEKRIRISEQELKEERDLVRHLLD